MNPAWTITSGEASRSHTAPVKRETLSLVSSEGLQRRAVVPHHLLVLLSRQVKSLKKWRKIEDRHCATLRPSRDHGGGANARVSDSVDTSRVADTSHPHQWLLLLLLLFLLL